MPATAEPKETRFNIGVGTILKIVVVLAVCYLLFFLRDLVLVVLTAVVIASAVEPGTKWFRKRNIPRLPAVILIYAIVGIILAGAFYFLFLPLLGETSAFLVDLPSYLDDVDVWKPITDSSVGSQPVIQELTGDISLKDIALQVNQVVSNFSQGFLSTASFIFGGILSFILILVLSFYLAVQEDGVTNFLRVLTPLKYENYIVDLWQRSQLKIGLWMQGQILLAILVGVLVYLGLLILGVPNALTLGFLAAVFEIIPIFGPIIAAIPALMFGFLDGGITLAILVIGLYVIVQQFESNLIYPLVVKKVVGVPPLLSIVALIAGLQLVGFLGVILSVPVAAIILEYISDLELAKKKVATRTET